MDARIPWSLLCFKVFYRLFKTPGYFFLDEHPVVEQTSAGSSFHNQNKIIFWALKQTAPNEDRGSVNEASVHQKDGRMNWVRPRIHSRRKAFPTEAGGL